jgi:hypothetical protein
MHSIKKASISTKSKDGYENEEREEERGNERHAYNGVVSGSLNL